MSARVEAAPELRGTGLETALATPEDWFSAEGAEVLKDHPRTAVVRREIAGRVVYLKRFKGYAWYRRVETALRGSIARRCRDEAALLTDAGFETPRILAVVESGADSWIVSEGRDDARPAGTLWLEEASTWPSGERRDLLERGAHFLRRLHDAGFYSRDSNADNFLVTTGKRFVLLELENFRRLRRVSVRRRIKNLVQLHRVVRGRLSGRDAVRFVRAYLRAGGDRRETLREWWPRLVVLDERKEQEYRVRAARRHAQGPAGFPVRPDRGKDTPR